jgi:hypothetical protein
MTGDESRSREACEEDACHTCLRTLSIMRAINSSGHGRISGAQRSATQKRVSSCRSRNEECEDVAVASLSTDARMSSMSIAKMAEFKLY